MQFKSRHFAVAQADAAAGLLLTPANLGFNPAHGFRRAQISTNDFGGGLGEFTIEFSPAGTSSLYPFQLSATPIGGTDVVLVGRDDDPLFESLKISFANVTGDIEVHVGFVDPDNK